MKLNSVFPSKYIKVDDLQGRTVTVTIRACMMEQLDQDTKLILHFLGKEKGFVCNKTNAERISLLHGDDTDGWIGKQIAIGPEMVNNLQGKAMMAIRVKDLPSMAPAAAAPSKAALAPATAPVKAEAPFDDEIPF